MRAALSLASLLTLALASPPARAQQAPHSEDTERLLRDGVQQRRQGRDEDAVVTFDAAVRRCDCGEAFAQRGLARLALARWLVAYEDLTRALGVSDPWVSRNRAELEAARDAAEAHRAILQIECGPARGAVRVDGATVGVCSPDGALTLVRAVEGTSLALRVELDRADRPSYTVSLRGGEPPVSVFLPPMPDVARVGRDPRPYLRVASVASAALAVGGVALAVVSEVQRDRELVFFNDDNLCLVASRTREENCGVYGAAAARWQTARTAGITAGALFGAAALATGLASVFVRWPRDGAPRATLSLQGLTVEGSF